MDIFGWDEKQNVPTVNYPEECRACLICELNCANQAIDVQFPMHALLDFDIDPKKAMEK
jgi:NAD-dependent dihydropyrimidine dehydrogenase PreA subunit